MSRPANPPLVVIMGALGSFTEYNRLLCAERTLAAPHSAVKRLARWFNDLTQTENRVTARKKSA